MSEQDDVHLQKEIVHVPNFPSPISQLGKGHVRNRLLTERENGPESTLFVGSAYAPAGQIVPDSENPIKILKDIKWNIDFSAQFIRRACSEVTDEGGVNVDQALESRGATFLRNEGSAWPMNDAEKKRSLIRLIQTRYNSGQWGGGEFGDAARALEDVESAWGSN